MNRREFLAGAGATALGLAVPRLYLPHIIARPPVPTPTPTQPRIERACWFPARWAESWTDPGGVGWMDQRLLDDAGELTDVGAVYAGLGS